MKTILHLYDKAKKVVTKEIPISKVIELGLFDKLTKRNMIFLTASLNSLMNISRKLMKSLTQLCKEETHNDYRLCRR